MVGRRPLPLPGIPRAVVDVEVCRGPGATATRGTGRPGGARRPARRGRDARTRRGAPALGRQHPGDHPGDDRAPHRCAAHHPAADARAGPREPRAAAVADRRPDPRQPLTCAFPSKEGKHNRRSGSPQSCGVVPAGAPWMP
ncbi:hypothetical protein L7F22_008626 [Adiantum nelumboides]|nr:hypothetical protein [Adiantum nelumboides]